MDDFPTPDATRRDGVDACPIVLADEIPWGFARPMTRLMPIVHRDIDPFGRIVEMIGTRAELSYPIAVRTLLQGLRVSGDDVPTKCLYENFLSLAVAMLRLAHEIDEDTARTILQVQQSEIPRLVHKVLTVATRSYRTSQSGTLRVG